jgi:general secretion pathway protein M
MRWCCSRWTKGLDVTANPAAARAFWQGLAPRERAAVALAALVVGVGLVWGLLLAPALGTLHKAEQERIALAAQAQQMQRMARQAEALKALPQLHAADALRALQTTTDQRLGTAARLTAQGDRASVTLTRVDAAQLAAWLADARANARATVQDMRLTRDAAAPSNSAPLWSGTLSLALP